MTRRLTCKTPPRSTGPFEAFAVPAEKKAKLDTNEDNHKKLDEAPAASNPSKGAKHVEEKKTGNKTLCMSEDGRAHDHLIIEKETINSVA